ncbi:MAG: hydantoinase B/oxoprolinase family protein, partial [Verrucomicrobiales bacterium]
GGKGKHRGGNGIVREIEFLEPLSVSFLTQRRFTSPRGLAGGEDGKSGLQVRIRRDGREEVLAPVTSYVAEAGERVRIETPGGGAWGSENDSPSDGSILDMGA